MLRLFSTLKRIISEQSKWGTKSTWGRVIRLQSLIRISKPSSNSGNPAFKNALQRLLEKFDQ